jgi:hypothetical protein
MSETKPYGGGYQAPYDTPGERRGMSGCAKAFLILGALGIAALLACCVGGWFYMRSAIVTDATEVRSVADDIVDWDFNGELEGRFAARFFFARVAILGERDKGIVMVVDSQFADARDMGRRMDEQFEGQMQTDDELTEETEVIEEGSREVTIKGETVQLQFNKTQGVDSGKIYWEVVGVVPGTEHSAFVFVKVLEETYSEEEVLRRFEGIR